MSTLPHDTQFPNLAEHIERGGPLPPWPVDQPFDEADAFVMRWSAVGFVAVVLMGFAGWLS
jgi:hypothetical protein